MDDIRDLARNELWVQSLERSRARREAGRGGQGRTRAENPVRSARERPVRSGRETPRRDRGDRSSTPRRIVPAAAALVVLALLLVVASGTFGGSARTARLAARVKSVRAEQGGPTNAGSGGAGPVSTKVLTGLGPANAPKTCGATVGSSNYFNPLAAAKVTPERIDQGVDYAGTGTLGAIGAARITYVGTAGTGWPGAFIEYRLIDGADAGCYVFYAEGVKPTPGLRAGQVVGPGQPVATLIPGWSTGIELGWGAGYKTVTYAAAKHQWSARSDADSIATGAGKSFSALIHSLGGPPGKQEG